MPDTFDDRYASLLATLTELADLLTRYGEDHWAEWVTSSRALIERGQAAGLGKLLAAFGGMGSLADVVLHPAEGQPVPTAAVHAANRRLTNLTERAFSLATELRRELDRERRGSGR